MIAGWVDTHNLYAEVVYLFEQTSLGEIASGIFLALILKCINSHPLSIQTEFS